MQWDRITHRGQHCLTACLAAVVLLFAARGAVATPAICHVVGGGRNMVIVGDQFGSATVQAKYLLRPAPRSLGELETLVHSSAARAPGPPAHSAGRHSELVAADDQRPRDGVRVAP